MSRAIHATTASGDEVTLEANAQHCARGRTVAQVEHNAMQALDLVRATLAALSGVTEALDRLGLLLSHSRGAEALRPALQRTIEQLGQSIHGARLRDDPLLSGDSATFVVDGPQDLTSAPLEIHLPDLSREYVALAELDLADSNEALLGAQHARLMSLVLAANKQLQHTAERLTGILSSQRPTHNEARPRAEDEGFVAMIQSVRDSVLHAGDLALRVQGSPSTRATWLIEALRDAR